MKKNSPWFGLAGAVLILSAAGGCVGYRLGSTLPPGIRSVFVTTFLNETEEPQIETVTTQATIQEFQRDGTLRVLARDQADSTLEVVLTEFSLEPLRYLRDRATTAREYRMKITATVRLTRLRPAPTVVLDRSVFGEATFEMTGDLSSSKQRVLPEAAADLARRIVQNIVEYW